ncbi:alpha/beta hydrolase [Thioclava sp. GXIMD2076]|uniref:alpha/beta fold hydrolase n=1 Tax=Thioclava sp. GXIMD2076 TaxID=3131931 RepID=UPI0030D0F23A
MTFAISALKYPLLLALCAGVVSGCTVLKAEHREARAEARYPPTGTMVTLADGPHAGQIVHVKVEGPEDAPQIVLIHGASGSLRDMTFRLAPALVEDHRLFIVDRPGFGYSQPMEDDSIFQQAAVLRQAVDQLGAKTPMVLGHSYGGAVALAWATQAPDSLSSLVLLSAASQTWEGDLPWLYKLTAPPLGQTLAVPLITAWAPESAVTSAVEEVFEPEAMPDGYIAHFGPDMTLRRVTMRANARQRAHLKAEIAQMVPDYGKVSVPVELLHGDQDTTVGLEIHSRPTARALPHARLTVLKGAGHMIEQTRVPDVLEAIKRLEN